ncbi:MAG: peptidoglycan DD-metalloendopeptidase family protein [Anaerolineae bacterium]|nr:peptidoglycan DD-metalloendopeptidase family protein [Anaerolineae bacterium]
MPETTNTNNPRNRLAAVLVVILTIALAILGCLFLLGGIYRLVAWGSTKATRFIPFLGVLCLLIALVAAAVRRRWDRTTTTAVLLSLVAILTDIPDFVPMAYPASLRSTRPAATVRLPSDVPMLVGQGGDRLENNNHADVPNQRWAYDFLVYPYYTGSSRLQDYGCYGVTVLAPAAGVVTTAHDGEPDTIPGESPTSTRGNYVVIQLEETGTYLFIAHLKPGSVSVESGQRVEEGQPIGRCGSSGNSSEPHIHIHHQRQNPEAYSDDFIWFAEGLPLCFRDHDGPAMPEGGFTEGTHGEPLGPTVRHVGP